MKVALRISIASLILALFIVLPAYAQDAGSITMTPVTDDNYGFTGVVPEGWKAAGPGLTARATDTSDVALVAQQSAPVKPDALMQAILPQLGLQTAPESVGTHQGGALEWTLYKVDVTASGQTISVDLGVAEANGKSFIVLMQAMPGEYDTLHEQVFLPMLDALTPFSPESTEEVPYAQELVEIPSGDHTLAGTLTLPEGDGPYPVVVLVTGSGPQDRDESIAPIATIKPFALIADDLTRLGIAVLRYDDRGIGQSTGDFSTATTADFADDASAAIDYLLTRDDIDPEQIGLLGHSEGGMVAAILAANNEHLAFVISMAGIAVSGRETSLLQNEHSLDLQGITGEAKDQMMAAVNAAFDQATAGDADAAKKTIRDATLALLQTLPADQQQAVGDLEAAADQLAQQQGGAFASNWFRFFLSYNPADDWKTTTIPVLALFGGRDTQVDATINAPAMEAALEEAGNEDYDIVTLPNANHLFQEATTGELSEYGTLKQEFTADFLPTINDWILEHVTLSS